MCEEEGKWEDAFSQNTNRPLWRRGWRQSKEKGPHSATKKVHGGKQYERSKLMEALVYEITKQTKGEGPLIHTKQIPECQIAHVFVSFYF